MITFCPEHGKPEIARSPWGIPICFICCAEYAPAAAAIIAATRSEKPVTASAPADPLSQGMKSNAA